MLASTAARRILKPSRISMPARVRAPPPVMVLMTSWTVRSRIRRMIVSSSSLMRLTAVANRQPQT
jgi:hypothetical protein